jgi:hypothetical protein
MEAGLNMSWEQFSTSRGSILILDVPKTLSLAKGDVEAPSLQISKQFQVTVVMKNINQSVTQPFSLYILSISDGLLTVDSGSGMTIQQNSVLTPMDILHASGEHGNQRPYQRPSSYFGSGDFKKSLMSGIKSLRKHHVLSTGADVANILGVPGASSAASVLHKVGFGKVHKSALKHRHARGMGLIDEDE